MNTTLLFIAGIFIIILLFVIARFNYFSKLFFSGNPEVNPKGELLKLIIQSLGGFVLLFGALYSLSIANAMKENNNLLEKGNIADRFKNAIEMLDDEKSTTTLGGIYALHEIAKDNKEYREQVFNIFISYINSTTSKLKSWKDIPKPERFKTKPSIEVQTIIKLVFSKTKSIYKDYHARFENAKLYGAEFNDLNFSNSTFDNVEFQNSEFEESWFMQCNVYNTKFTLSNFTKAYFTGSKIWDNTYLDCCWFLMTRFNCCSFQDVDFSCSEIQANFDGTKLNICTFDGAKIISGMIGFDTFNGISLNIKSSKGLYCVNGIIARGCQVNNGLPLGNFRNILKSRIGEVGVLNKIEKAETFPDEKLKYYEELIDIELPETIFYHTVYSIKMNMLKNTGWLFSDISEFTQSDYDKIITTYENDLNQLYE